MLLWNVHTKTHILHSKTHHHLDSVLLDIGGIFKGILLANCLDKSMLKQSTKQLSNMPGAENIWLVFFLGCLI